MSHDLADDVSVVEYNSIKHGLRARTGGFELRMSRGEASETPPPDAEMITLGASEFGAGFYRAQALGTDGVNFRVVRCAQNWNPANLIAGLQIASASIQNVLALALAESGAKEPLPVAIPEDEKDFDRPWAEDMGGVNGLTIDFSPVDTIHIDPYSREKVAKIYSALELKLATSHRCAK
jgi:hypothetical protein